jgi:hypothetical protein
MTKYQKAEDYAEYLFTLSLNEIRKNHKVLGEGSSRIVVEYSPRIAIKLAKGVKGVLQNDGEFSLYFNPPNYAHKNLKRFLATILEAVYVEGSEDIKALIVRSYPKKLYHFRSKKINREFYKCVRMLRDVDVGDRDRYSSYRVIGNTLKIVDYGFNDRSSTYYHKERMKKVMLSAEARRKKQGQDARQARNQILRDLGFIK